MIKYTIRKVSSMVDSGSIDILGDGSLKREVMVISWWWECNVVDDSAIDMVGV